MPLMGCTTLKYLTTDLPAIDIIIIIIIILQQNIACMITTQCLILLCNNNCIGVVVSFQFFSDFFEPSFSERVISN